MGGWEESGRVWEGELTTGVWCQKIGVRHLCSGERAIEGKNDESREQTRYYPVYRRKVWLALMDTRMDMVIHRTKRDTPHVSLEMLSCSERWKLRAQTYHRALRLPRRISLIES